MTAYRAKPPANGWIVGLVALCLAGALTVVTAEEAGPATSLEDVLASIDRHHPSLVRAQLRVDEATGEVLAAEGAFDLYTTSSAAGTPVGTYDQQRLSIGVLQPTPLWGSSYFAGYRWGDDFRIYDGDLQTSRGGELSAWASLPLLRNRAIDGNRLRITNSALHRRRAEAERAGTRLSIRLDGALAYLKWWTAGHKRLVAQTLVQIAEARQQAIDEQVASGALAPIDSIDNQRLIFSRKERLVEADGAWHQAGARLTFYVRGEDGQPRDERTLVLPESLPRVAPPAQVEPQMLAAALATRPDLAALGQSAEVARNEVTWAKNQVLPELDVRGHLKQDFGRLQEYGPDIFTTNNLEAGLALRFAMPVQRRAARGFKAAATARAEARQTDLQIARELVRIELQAAHAVWVAASRRVELAEQSLAAARTLEEAERALFENGQSTLIFVNLRELARGEAQEKWIETLASLGEARVRYLTAAGNL